MSEEADQAPSSKKGGPGLFTALLFQGSLIPLALVLAWLVGLNLSADMQWSMRLLGQSLLATAVMFMAYLLIRPFDFAWARDLEQRVADMLQGLFRGHSLHWALPLSLLAGFGEEMLFRGFLQSAVGEWLNPLVGILLASLIFGAAHAITRAYFILACLMGLYMGLLYHWSGNLLLPILVHALYDWLAIVYYLRFRRGDTA